MQSSWVTLRVAGYHQWLGYSMVPPSHHSPATFRLRKKTHRVQNHLIFLCRCVDSTQPTSLCLPKPHTAWEEETFLLQA